MPGVHCAPLLADRADVVIVSVGWVLGRPVKERMINDAVSGAGRPTRDGPQIPQLLAASGGDVSRKDECYPAVIHEAGYGPALDSVAAADLCDFGNEARRDGSEGHSGRT